MDERELTALLRRGDQRGMELLLWHYGPLMKYVITPILPDPRDREDCPSEAALRVWEHIGQFDGQRGSWRAWLTAVTRNAALNHARHGGGEELDERLPAPEPGPEETLLRRERQAATRDVLARLHATDRALLYRKYYYQQSTAQIAAELATTERVVEGRIYRLKKHLRILLAGGCVCGLLFGTSYPMAWTAVDAGAQSGTAEIRAQLEKLGVPDYVLDDLAPEDLTACDGALRVVVETQNEPLNKDKQKALHITGVAVELPGERERWMIIQHFRWKGNPGFYGTEDLYRRLRFLGGADWHRPVCRLLHAPGWGELPGLRGLPHRGAPGRLSHQQLVQLHPSAHHLAVSRPVCHGDPDDKRLERCRGLYYHAVCDSVPSGGTTGALGLPRARRAGLPPPGSQTRKNGPGFTARPLWYQVSRLRPASPWRPRWPSPGRRGARPRSGRSGR